MVIRQALPFDVAPSARRRPARTTLIVAGSVAVHAAVAAYLAMMQFAPPKALPIADDPPITVDIFPLPKSPPPPPEPTKPQPKQPVKFNQVVTPVDIPTSVTPIQAESAEEPVRSVGPLASLNTGPVAPPSPPDPIIGNPTWLKRPGANEFARFYPDRAMRMSQEGSATITCAVTASGSLAGCRLVRETPENFGFGAATLKLAQYFKMSPRTVNGQPVEGGQVTIPIRFNLN